MQVAKPINQHLVARMHHHGGAGVFDNGRAAQVHLRLKQGVVVNRRVVDPFQGKVHRALAFVRVQQRAARIGHRLQAQLADLRNGHQVETNHLQEFVCAQLLLVKRFASVVWKVIGVSVYQGLDDIKVPRQASVVLEESTRQAQAMTMEVREKKKTASSSVSNELRTFAGSDL